MAALSTRLPLRTLAIPVLFALTTLMVASGTAHAETIDPVGIGDLLPSPETTVPKGQGTLYEEYTNPNLWMLDSDFGRWDILDPMGDTVARILMAMIVIIGTAVVVIVKWIFGLTSVPELQGALTSTIGGAAKGLSTTLLPAALAVGGLVAFAKHREGGGGGGLSQIAWVFVSGVVSVSLLSTPQVWVDGVDTTRQVGASVALNATAGGIAQGKQEFPFKLGHEPTYTGNGRDDMLRRSSDAVWRAYVADPWCLAEFGSLEACQKYGKDLLDQGPSVEARKEWLQANVKEQTVGADSANWRAGHNPVGRIAVLIPALIVLLIFAALVLALAFASLASLIGSLMLLVAGVVFACLWVIPGRPRQWGLRWFDQLLGLTLQSFIATMTLGCVLVVQVVSTQMFSTFQWVPSAGLSIAAAVMAFKFRKIMESIVGVAGATSSPIGTMLGMMATRSATRALRRRGRGGRGKGQHNAPVRTRPGGGSAGGSDGGGGGGGDNGPGTGGGGGTSGALVGRVPFRRPTPLPGGSGRSAQPDRVPEEKERLAGPPPSIPDDRTRKTPAPVRGPGPLPMHAATRTGDVAATAKPASNASAKPAAPTGGASTSTAPTGTFRQAPAPGAPGPRAIEARVIRESTPPTPQHTEPTPGRQRATQPPPPARRAAPARRTTPSRPAPRRPARRRDVPAQREG
ncbi:hypothetical protein [Streptomyces sp. NPDC051909]|uniref:hypothetical protein n=1 Tax=Streptomyces sp. NPDC051909 TaxID=3154944 RepID=UPI0034249207